MPDNVALAQFSTMSDVYFNDGRRDYLLFYKSSGDILSGLVSFFYVFCLYQERLNLEAYCIPFQKQRLSMKPYCISYLLKTLGWKRI